MMILSSPFLAFARTEIPYPQPQGFVTDITQTLNQNQKAGIEQDLSQFQKETGNEIAVLIVKTTAPETIEEYSIHVTDAWKIGQKKIDNGILFTIAMDDRTMRIEVGRGLEGALTDGESVQIINQHIKPLFQQGKFFEGIQAGLTVMKQIAKGEFDKNTLSTTNPDMTPDPFGTVMSIALFIVPCLLLTFGAGWMAKSKKILAGGITGAIIAGIAGFFAGIGLWYMITSIIGGGIIGLMIDKSVSGGTKGPGGTGRGGFWGGGFGGGGFGGGSSGGGGFGGFGGGGFSGGGGSGRW